MAFRRETHHGGSCCHPWWHDVRFLARAPGRAERPRIPWRSVVVGPRPGKTEDEEEGSGRGGRDRDAGPPDTSQLPVLSPMRPVRRRPKTPQPTVEFIGSGQVGADHRIGSGRQQVESHFIYQLVHDYRLGSSASLRQVKVVRDKASVLAQREKQRQYGLALREALRAKKTSRKKNDDGFKPSRRPGEASASDDEDEEEEEEKDGIGNSADAVDSQEGRTLEEEGLEGSAAPSPDKNGGKGGSSGDG